MRDLQKKAPLGTRDPKRGQDHLGETTIIVIMQSLIKGNEGRPITTDKQERGHQASEVEDLETGLPLAPCTGIGAGQEIELLDVVDLQGIGPI